MRIAQVAPLWESVPPKLYGGTERIVSLVRTLPGVLTALRRASSCLASSPSDCAAAVAAIVPASPMAESNRTRETTCRPVMI